MGERCKHWDLGQSPSWQTIWCILESKSAALVAAVFVDFPKNKWNFLHKNKLVIVRRCHLYHWLPVAMTIPSTRRRPMRSFSPEVVAMELGAYETSYNNWTVHTLTDYHILHGRLSSVQMRAVSRCQHTHEAEHRLVYTVEQTSSACICVSGLNFNIGEYLAKLQAIAWLSHALCAPGQHTANRRRKCTRQSRSCL